jgi:hypothetical protein
MALRRAPDSVGCSDEDGVAWRAKFIFTALDRDFDAMPIPQLTGGKCVTKKSVHAAERPEVGAYSKRRTTSLPPACIP